MPKVKVGDIKIYYEIHGEGEPFVMILGASASIEWLYTAIPVYSREYRLVVFDNRGAGRSDKPDIPYTTQMMADDLAGLLDAISIESAHIWGGSMGGMTAQQFALCYPKRVKSLILASTNCGGPHSNIMPDLEVYSTTERILELPLEERMIENLRLCVSQEFIDNNPGLIQQMVEAMMKYPIPTHGQMRQLEAVMSHNTYERLPEINAPTLVIHGDADRIVPVENARILASRIPNAELIIFKNVGHLVGIEAEEETNRIMLDFLRRHRNSS